MRTTRIIGAAAIVIGACCLLSSSTFVELDRMRVKLIDGQVEPTDSAVQIVTNQLGPLVELRQPLALIIRLANRNQATHEFAITVDGTVACRLRLSGNESRRVDCVANAWRLPSEQHDVTIRGPAAEWAVSYLEVATHHGNTSGANYLVILPRTSTHFVPPSLAFSALVLLALGVTILLVRPAVFPRWATFGHLALSGFVIVALAGVQISPWVSNYRIVISAWTLVLWLGMLCLPQVWTAGWWLIGPRAGALRPWLRWTRPALIAFGAAAVFSIVVVSELHEIHRGNYSGFLMISRRMFDANPLLKSRDDIRQSLILLDGGGYDGQFVYFAAFDPFMRAFTDDPVKYRDVVDAVPYRYGRIGFSLLTRSACGGQWQCYPGMQVWLVLIGLFVSALTLARMADDEHLSPLIGGLVLVIPGFWQSIQGALPEPVAAATLLVGVLCASRNRWVLAGVLFALSLIIRETGVILVCVLIGAAALSGRRREAVTLALLALTPVILWRLYVGWTIFPDWGFAGFLDHPSDLGWPFAGFADLWGAIQRGDYYPDGPPMSRAGITYPLLLTSAVAMATALTLRAPSAINIAALAYGVLAVSLNFRMIWVHVGNGQRGTYEVFLALTLSLLAIRAYPHRLRLALAAFWCAAAAYVFFGAYDAEYIRAALAFPS